MRLPQHVKVVGKFRTDDRFDYFCGCLLVLICIWCNQGNFFDALRRKVDLVVFVLAKGTTIANQGAIGSFLDTLTAESLSAFGAKTSEYSWMVAHEMC